MPISVRIFCDYCGDPCEHDATDSLRQAIDQAEAFGWIIDGSRETTEEICCPECFAAAGQRKPDRPKKGRPDA